MRTREAKKPEAERITKELWLPLAREMEKISDFNQLKEDLDIDQCIEHRKTGIREKGKHTFIAEEGQKLIGFISVKIKESAPVFKRGDKLKVNELFVKPEFRREGAASKLLEEAVKTGEAEGCSTIELEVDTPNEEAKEFYRSEDFKTVRERFYKNLD